MHIICVLLWEVHSSVSANVMAQKGILGTLLGYCYNIIVICCSSPFCTLCIVV